MNSLRDMRNKSVEQLKAAMEKFKNVDWYRVKFIPKGADDPLPPIPDVVEITPEDVEAAIKDWDETMPQYAGMLRSRVENKRDFDGEDS